MFSRVSALGPSRPLLLRLPCIPGGSEAALETRGRWPLPCPARAEYEIQRCFGTNSVIHSKKDDSSIPGAKISDSVAENQDDEKKNAKNHLLKIIKDMKVELSATNMLKDTKTHINKLQKKEKVKDLGRMSRVSQKAVEESSPESHQSPSPELVAAATAVADSLPFDKLSVKSELLSQLRKHETNFREEGKEAIKISDIISDMKIAKSSTSRIYARPDHQIQFDEGHGFLSTKELLDLDSKKRKGLFKGKRLNIFPVIETASEEASETETSPTLWDVEFAKQLAKVNQQLPQNAFEEMIQWTNEGKLWTFPINNEAGIVDDGADFHEHIFLDKHLEDFPKQGPIRHFMELVVCGLSKNPFLTVKEKVEHIEWFRNYFHEKKNILEENNIQFN